MGNNCNCTAHMPGTLEFESLDNQVRVPDISPHHKKKIQLLWSHFEREHLLHDIGIHVFQLLFDKRPRLRKFFYSAVVVRDYSIFLEDYEIKNSFINNYSERASINVITNSKEGQISCVSNQDSRFFSQSQTPLGYKKQSYEVAEVKSIPLSRDQTEGDRRYSKYTEDISTEEILQEDGMKSHIDTIVESFANLIGEIGNDRDFCDHLLHLQNIHRGLDERVIRYLCKSDYGLLFTCFDESFYSFAPKLYKGSTKEAMRHFFKMVYFVITYYMPKEPFIKPERVIPRGTSLVTSLKNKLNTN